MRKKLRRVIIFIVAIIATISFCSFSYAQSEEVLNVSYDINVNALSVEGNINTAQRVFVNVIIIPYSMKYTALTNEVIIGTEKKILKTFETDSKGSFSERIVIPEHFEGQRYLVSLSNDSFFRDFMIVCVDIKELSAFVTTLNKAGKSGISTLLIQNGEYLLLDNGKLSKNHIYISDILYQFRPTNGYSENDFMNSYFTAEGLAQVQNKEISLEEMLIEYSAFLDEDYAGMYGSLSEKEKQIVQDLFFGNLSGSSFRKVYASIQFVAQMRSSASSMQMADILLAYYQNNDLSLNDYNSLENSYYKDNVFNRLFAKRTQMQSEAIIIQMFKDIVSEEKNEEKRFDSIFDPSSRVGGGTTTTVSNQQFDIGQIQPLEKELFTDMKNHWASEAVKAMYDLKIINGFDDGSFRPEQYVTRAEFAKMIAMLLRLEGNSGKSFNDVSSDIWYSSFISRVSQAGIIYGDGTNFYPEDNITREDATVILGRVLEYSASNIIDKTINDYADYNEISSYAKEAVAKLSGAGLISGYDGKFNPKAPATRAEAATLLYRLSKYIK